MISDSQNACLREVARRAADEPAWSAFAAYCTGRERGLRREALAHLDRFLADARGWPFPERRRFTDWMCRCLTELGESPAYGIAPQPLSARLLAPTLSEWREREPADATPCRWLGMYFAHVVYPGVRAGLVPSGPAAPEYLREALRRDPSDQLARVRLVELLVGNAEYACHHLPHYYIGEPKDDEACLAEAAELVEGVTDEAERVRLLRETEAAARLVADWVEFSRAGEGTFQEWCDRRGRNYRWVRAFYYQM